MPFNAFLSLVILSVSGCYRSHIQANPLKLEFLSSRSSTHFSYHVLPSRLVSCFAGSVLCRTVLCCVASWSFESCRIFEFRIVSYL